MTSRMLAIAGLVTPLARAAGPNGQVSRIMTAGGGVLGERYEKQRHNLSTDTLFVFVATDLRIRSLHEPRWSCQQDGTGSYGRLCRRLQQHELEAVRPV